MELPTACAGYRHTCSFQNAARFAEWMSKRGGLRVWLSIDLSDPSKSWTTPANKTDGTPTEKPTWQAGNDSVLITDPKEIGVSKDVEVKRFHVAIRMGGQGFSYKCTDASSRKIRKEVARAGEGAYYEFDYETQEAVIYRPDDWMSLADWMKENHFSV